MSNNNQPIIESTMDGKRKEDCRNITENDKTKDDDSNDVQEKTMSTEEHYQTKTAKENDKAGKHVASMTDGKEKDGIIQVGLSNEDVTRNKTDSGLMAESSESCEESKHIIKHSVHSVDVELQHHVELVRDENDKSKDKEGDMNKRKNSKIVNDAGACYTGSADKEHQLQETTINYISGDVELFKTKGICEKDMAEHTDLHAGDTVSSSDSAALKSDVGDDQSSAVSYTNGDYNIERLAHIKDICIDVGRMVMATEMSIMDQQSPSISAVQDDDPVILNTQQLELTDKSSDSAEDPVDMDTPVAIQIEIDTQKQDTAIEVKHEAILKQSSVESAKTESLLEKVCRRCMFTDLPPLPKKVVRIFVSSTFTDTKEERNALMQHVYPKLSDYCRETHGLEFQIVDMRWGVPEQASDNHATTDLCIHEIQKCQEVSAGPTFVAIVGDKYGYRPIPSTISEQVFETISKYGSEENWPLVKHWYQKDVNAIPPVFLLQRISVMIPDVNNTENEELRNDAWSKWKDVNTKLTNILREAALEAYNDNQIEISDKHMFFMSVTENEITTGILENEQKAKESCYCIIRKIPDINEHILEKPLPRFIDTHSPEEIDTEAQALLKNLRDVKLNNTLPEANLTKLDIEWSASGAAVSIDQFSDIDIAKYAQKMLQNRELVAYKHKVYLDKICSNFFKKICRLITVGNAKQTDLYDELSTELLQHFHLAKLRCDVFDGREEILQDANEHLINSKTESPMIIYGHSGCGKTSVMAKIMENVSNKLWRQDEQYDYILVARFLGTSTKTSNVHQLLVTMCQQLSVAFRILWTEPPQFSELVKSFYKLLQNATMANPILILLDSIDQLMPVYNAYKLDWLPDEFPPHVKLIASTIDEGYDILQNFKCKYSSIGLKCIEVLALGEKLGMRVIEKWLQHENRCMTYQQREVIQKALLQCSLPLYARIAFDHIRKWKSFDKPDIKQLEVTVKGAINQLFKYMEDKFGVSIVKHCLSYLTASRYGLSEAELEHILSLDDQLLNKVFKFWKPPVRRIPPLIWTRIRAEIHSYIVERSADNTVVLYWYHRQFIQTTRAKYLKEPVFVRYIEDNLIEYFTGKWSQGAKKPFTYTEAQIKRFKLDSASSSADRKIPAQPYWNKNRDSIRYNERKLSELPYHCLKNKNYTQLKELNFFNYYWLYAKMKSTSVQQMIEEIDIFMQADKVLKRDNEMKLLYANLQLIRPYILQYPESLAYEIVGRLSTFIGHFPNITKLIAMCDKVSHSPLMPLFSCFETAGFGFSQNIIFRTKEPWNIGGTFTCSSDFKTIYIIDYNDDALPVIYTWDAGSGEQIHEMIINKLKPDSEKFTTDLYFRANIVKDGKEMLAFYKQRMDYTYNKSIKAGYGYIDIINLSNGVVLKTYESFLYRDEFLNPLYYLTDNYMCVSFGWKMPLIQFTTDTKNNYNRPTFLDETESYFIMCGKEQTIVRSMETKVLIGEFNVSNQIAVTASTDFKVIAMMSADIKTISIFDFSNKLMKPKRHFYQLFKTKHVFTIDEKTSAMISTVFKGVIEIQHDGSEKELTNNRVIMSICPNGRYLLVVFLGSKWLAFLWSLNIGRYRARLIGPVTTYGMNTSSFLPMFNADGTAVVYTNKENKVVSVSTETAQIINEYQMKQSIKALHVSTVSNKMAVMLQKSIMLLDVLKIDEGNSRGPKRKVMQHNSGHVNEVLLYREIGVTGINKEISLSKTNDKVEIFEVEDQARIADVDTLTSATRNLKHAVDKHFTPNGIRSIQVHRKLQVDDTSNEIIKYTPRSGDYILRYHSIVKDTVATNEVIQIPGLNSEISSFNHFTLKEGDRIMNKAKIKLRVNKEDNGKFEIMLIPSVISIYTSEELKLRKLQTFTIYQESIMACCNNFLVTAKTNARGRNFINIFNQLEGKAVATHDMRSKCQCAKFSLDERWLFVVDQFLCVRRYEGPLFSVSEIQLDLMSGELSSSYKVKVVYLFPENYDGLLVQYGPKGPDAYVTSRYLFANMSSREVSAEMVASPTFDDISRDGRFAIDRELNVFDLETGTLFAKVPHYSKGKEEDGLAMKMFYQKKLNYTDALSMTFRACITNDNKYIVYVSSHDNTIHLASIRGKSIKIITSCFTHVDALSQNHVLELRHFGRIIIIRTPDKMIPICIQDQQHNSDQPYGTEHERVLAIVKQIESNYLKTKKLQLQ